ncbi:MAG TPA: hypothetical protein VKU41_13360 [Polyangiaceae bacterium]|nr:hypothetical protein [Polyangiaceae bacterium]
MPVPAAVRRAPRVLLGTFCLYHMGASLLSNMPSTTAFGGELRAPFEAYIFHAGLWQSWTMFTTIPYFRSIHPVLLAHAPGGAETEYGAILPGLEGYRQRTRLTGLFLRYTFPAPDMAGFARGYVHDACDAIEAASGVRPAFVGLRLDSEHLVPLDRVRTSGQTSVPGRELSAASGPCD